MFVRNIIMCVRNIFLFLRNIYNNIIDPKLNLVKD